jgi:hypothetical protein
MFFHGFAPFWEHSFSNEKAKYKNFTPKTPTPETINNPT